jgi:hypothetical protein
MTIFPRAAVMGLSLVWVAACGQAEFASPSSVKSSKSPGSATSSTPSGTTTPAPAPTTDTITTDTGINGKAPQGLNTADAKPATGVDGKGAHAPGGLSVGAAAATGTIQVSPTEIVFGSAKVFHIGDGKYGGSSCQQTIEAYALSGTKYYFEFEVTEADTQV